MTIKQYKELIEEKKKILDVIFDEYTTPDYTEIIGKQGTDVVKFRVYKSGVVTEK